MAGNNTPPAQTPAKSGLSLYANLLDPSSSAPGTISRAPVVFKAPSQDDAPSDEAAKKQQINAAALRFQPTKRPQVAQKPKPKPVSAISNITPQKVPPASDVAAPPVANTTPSSFAARQPPKSTLADWTADDEDVNGFYAGERRQRGGKRRKKKNNRESEAIPQNWDDNYDPSRPTNYEEYKNSDEKIQEIRDWKDRLYAHRMTNRRGSSESDGEDDYRPAMSNQFAPPPMDFGPPSSYDNSSAPPPVPSASIPDDATGEDAFARRLRMSQMAQDSAPPPPPPPPQSQPPEPAGMISRAPVRYNLPSAPADIPASEAELEEKLASEQQSEESQTAEDPDAQRSIRPGQKGFAERLLTKYGWTKGTGLGATSSGIINPLQVKVEKQKKKPDSEGGGFVGPGGRGKIIGGKKSKAAMEDEHGKFGPMSDVVVLLGMVDGLDLDEEMAGEEGGLMQEIGDECAEKYGRVERVYIDRSTTGPQVPVFVKFTSQLSALRAVNALEGRIFNGNPITARFFDSDKFAEDDHSL